jgi:hypothetical protein
MLVDCVGKNSVVLISASAMKNWYTNYSDDARYEFRACRVLDLSPIITYLVFPRGISVLKKNEQH